MKHFRPPLDTAREPRKRLVQHVRVMVIERDADVSSRPLRDMRFELYSAERNKIMVRMLRWAIGSGHRVVFERNADGAA